jgi:hypothetical protein
MNTIMSQSNHSLGKRKSAAFVPGMNRPLPFFYPCTLNIKVLLNKTSTVAPTSLTEIAINLSKSLAGSSIYLKFKMNFWTIRIEHTGKHYKL